MNSNYIFEDVIEFFRSYQGEAPFTGLNSLFIRFKKCNLINICPFCDTKKLMLETKGFIVPFSSVVDNIHQYNISCITFTGGEPTLEIYRKQILKFIDFIDSRYKSLLKKKFLIETNGYGIIEIANKIPKHIRPSFTMVWSPKFFNDQMFEEILNKYNKLKNLDINYIIKPVVTDQTIEYIKIFVNQMNDDEKSHVYLMPEGITTEQLLKHSKRTSALAYEMHVNLSPRLQISYNLP